MVKEDRNKEMYKIITDTVKEGNINLLNDLLATDLSIKIGSITNDEGDNLLLQAIYARKMPMIEYLIEKKGINPSATNQKSGFTALHAAARVGYLDAIKYLIEKHRIDPNVLTNAGNTALKLARKYEHKNVVNYLEPLTTFQEQPGIKPAPKPEAPPSTTTIPKQPSSTTPSQSYGNTCFIDASLRCLQTCDQLTMTLAKSIPKPKPDSIPDLYITLVNQLNKLPLRDINRTPFYLESWKIMHKTVDTQQDASEYLNDLLTQFNCNNIITMLNPLKLGNGHTIRDLLQASINENIDLLLKATPYFILPINRAHFDPNTNKYSKLKQATPFDLDLDYPDSLLPNYELSAVIMHSGESLTSGHYTAYVKREDGWHYYDRSFDKKVSPEKMAEIAKRGLGADHFNEPYNIDESKTPVIFFYRKKS
jgi:hypothetical protein